MTLREAAEEIVECVSIDGVRYKGPYAPDSVQVEASIAIDESKIESIIARCAADEREACLTRAAEAMVKIGLHPLQRHNVLRAIEGSDSP